jgi:hypothetical protein
MLVAFSCLVSVVVYYGFSTNYTARVFHESGFRAQYESGIYKYRILGRYLLLKTHRLAKSQNAPAHILRQLFAHPPASALVLDRQAEGTFYEAYFLQNTFFMAVASVFLYLILAGTTATETAYQVQLVVAATLLMGVSQYVVCPYDTLSYALILLSFLLIMRPFRFSFPLLVLVLVLSTLTRESAALTLSFYFAYKRAKLLQLARRETVQLSILLGAFLVTYTLLRLHFGFANAIWQDLLWRENFTNLYSLTGVLALPVVSYLICAGSPNLKPCLLFLAASSPYLVAMLIIGDCWEIRLWVPVWLGLICLAGNSPGKESPFGDDSDPRLVLG